MILLIIEEFTMKHCMVTVLVLAAAIFSVSCGKKIGPEKPQKETVAEHKWTAIVTASTNLIVRAKPEKTGAKLGVIPHGAIVDVLQEGDTEITIDKITSKWYRVSYNGTEGWAFGGYLDIAKAQKNSLSEESDPRKYIGRTFEGLDPALKKRTVSSVMLKNGITFYAFEYNAEYLLMVSESAGKGSSMKVTDAIRISHNGKNEKVFFPNGECKSGDLRDPILAVASEPAGKDCEYTAVTRAWTVDLETNRFSPAMPEGIKCKSVCCGDGCD
jgi:uncharacterized protein YgiM (DUF1202 family)